MTLVLDSGLTAPMRELLAAGLLGNSPLRWGLALGIAVLAYLLLGLLKAMVRGRLQRLAQCTETGFDDMLVGAVGRTRALFLVLLALFLGSLILDLPDNAALWIKRLFFIAFFIQAGLWASDVVDFLVKGYIERKGAEEPTRLALVGLFSFLGQVVVWSLVVLLALDNLGIDVTALIAGLGVGGIAVGLALQNVLKDTFASLSIILDKPFEVGDFILVGSEAGTVEKIGIKTTRVRSLSGEQLVFGNDDLLTSRIRNFKRMQERRIVFTFGVVYETPPNTLAEIPPMVEEIVRSIDRTRFDRAHFKAFGDSSLDFEVVYYVQLPDYVVYMDIQQQINLELCRRFAELGIEFAYPTRTLLLRGDRQPIRTELVGD